MGRFLFTGTKARKEGVADTGLGLCDPEWPFLMAFISFLIMASASVVSGSFSILLPETQALREKERSLAWTIHCSSLNRRWNVRLEIGSREKS